MLQKAIHASVNDEVLPHERPDVDYLVERTSLSGLEGLTAGKTTLRQYGVPITITEAVEPWEHEHTIQHLSNSDGRPELSTKFIPSKDMRNKRRLVLRSSNSREAVKG